VVVATLIAAYMWAKRHWPFVLAGLCIGFVVWLKRHK
jgi:membrane-associated phospholipid phosphatase